jgi:GNAT superfamily N-acetyltransferase
LVAPLVASSQHLETMTVRLDTLTGESLIACLPALARLRIEVFRAWPYLYDGDEAYERAYLQTYAACPRAAVIVAWDGGEPVGASTCIPLEEAGAVVEPFRKRGWEPSRFFYFGESVLRPAYRGRGIGVAFFEAREAHALSVSNCDHACFCSVRRPPNHPACPPDYTPLDAFWRRRGYQPVPGLECTMSWKDVGETAETAKPLVFWIKMLRSGAPL